VVKGAGQLPGIEAVRCVVKEKRKGDRARARRRAGLRQARKSPAAKSWGSVNLPNSSQRNWSTSPPCHRQSLGRPWSVAASLLCIVNTGKIAVKPTRMTGMRRAGAPHGCSGRSRRTANIFGATSRVKPDIPKTLRSLGAGGTNVCVSHATVQRDIEPAP